MCQRYEVHEIDFAHVFRVWDNAEERWIYNRNGQTFETSYLPGAHFVADKLNDTLINRYNVQAGTTS